MVIVMPSTDPHTKRDGENHERPRTCPSHLRFRINRDPHKPMSFVFQHPLKMEPIRSSETSDLNIHTPEKYPEELSTFIQHGESLKTRNTIITSKDQQKHHPMYAIPTIWTLENIL